MRGLAAVILNKIILSGLGIGIVNRRAHCFDHLGDLCIPACRVEKRRVQPDIGEAVTSLVEMFEWRFVVRWFVGELDQQLLARLLAPML
jgi:hypothetical protein